MTITPSPIEVEHARSSRGGWERWQLELWGVEWPPPKGWKRALADRYMSEQRARIGVLRGG